MRPISEARAQNGIAAGEKPNLRARTLTAPVIESSQRALISPFDRVKKLGRSRHEWSNKPAAGGPTHLVLGAIQWVLDRLVWVKPPWLQVGSLRPEDNAVFLSQIGPALGRRVVGGHPPQELQHA